MSTNKQIRTRLAPSPTGKLFHLGNLRTMMYNYFLAKQNGGKFLIRLEDTDQDRYEPTFIQHFKDTLEWLGIEADYSFWNPEPEVGSYIQSERDYMKYVNILLDKGLAYYAFDTKDDLASLKEKGLKYDSTTRLDLKNSLTMTSEEVEEMIKTTPYTIRFKVEANEDITFTDEILGEITINTNVIDDKVLIKSNGIGSYHLCNVCDDHDMKITHVLRGQEWVNSTPFHVLLYRAFEWETPIYAHLPLIMNPVGIPGKLSKRSSGKHGIPISPIGYTDGDGNFVNGWKEEGYSPEALINYISLLGWSPKGETDVLTMEELIEQFDLSTVKKSSAKFDLVKAKSINSEHLRATPNSELLEFVSIADNRYSRHQMLEIVELAKSRSIVKSDLNDVVKMFFEKPKYDKADKLLTEDYRKVVKNFINEVGNVDFNKDSIKAKLLDISEKNNVKLGKVMPGLRLSLVGGVSGPDIPTTISLLGTEEVIARLSISL